MMNFLPEFTIGACFLAFILTSIYSWYLVLSTDYEEAQSIQGFARRMYRFSEVVVWIEIAIGFTVAAIAVGSWLMGLV